MVDNLKEKSETLKRAVGARIRMLRVRAGFSSIEAAAEAMGVHPNSVGDVERGANFISPEMTVRMIETYRLGDGAPLLGGSTALTPTWREALDVIARELDQRPARDPLAERIAKLAPSRRAQLEAALGAIEESSTTADDELRKKDEKLLDK